MRFGTLIAAIAAVVCFNCAGGSQDSPVPRINPSPEYAFASVQGSLGEDNGTSPETFCNGVDDDSDGSVDDGCDSDQDGWCEDGKIVSSFVACVFGPGDCNDGNENMNPGMNEVCNGVDDDCDDQTDRYANGIQLWQNCYTGPIGTENISGCHAGISWCDKGAYIPCQGEVTPVAESCDTKDNDCDSSTDEDFTTLGQACDGAGDSDLCKEGVFQCDDAGKVKCTDTTSNTVEVCDGATDEDCDGLVDEGLTQKCMHFVTCKEFDSCAPCATPPKEVCDFIDNDCDGATDEGFEEVGMACDGLDADFCGMGTWACAEDGSVVCNEDITFTETCDGFDNDCNGVVDDPFGNKGMVCDGPDSDKCQHGTYTCMQDGSGLECTNENPVNITEACNNFDDDCNGVVDNNPNDAGGACGPAEKGQCKPGIVVCKSGNLECAGSVEPTPETCDEKDNDCNGQTDNGFAVGTPCDGKDTDMCAEGVVVCDGQGGTVCSDTTGDKVETCDGVDNDCNGVADTDAFPNKGKSCDGPDADKCMLGTSTCKADGTGLECTNEWASFSENCGTPDDDNCNGQKNEGCPDEDALAEFCVMWILNGVALSSITIMGVECTASGCSSWDTLEFKSGPTSLIMWCPALDEADDLVEWNGAFSPKYKSPFGYDAEWVAHGLSSVPDVVGIVGDVLMSSDGGKSYELVLDHDLHSAPDLEIVMGPFVTTVSANEDGGFNFVTVRTAGGGGGG